MTTRTGPLRGLKVIEMAGLGPAPMCAMLLADLGATVIRVDRRTPADLGVRRPRHYDLLEGFRPGAMERLGLGPEVALGRNPRLVYGRMTGYGQDGPLAQTAGHDLNYIAMAGALRTFGRPGQKQTVPMSVLGDHGGVALYLAFGLLAALFEAGRSGQGQVVDAAMVDGVASLHTIILGLRAAGLWQGRARQEPAGRRCPFLRGLRADGKFISVAAVERRFYDQLLERLEIPAGQIGPHTDPASWDQGKAILAERFKQRTRAQWCELLEGTDVCFAPVLSWEEAARHPLMKERATFCEVDGVLQPAPAPRFSRTAPATPAAPKEISPANNTAALEKWLGRDAVAAPGRHHFLNRWSTTPPSAAGLLATSCTASTNATRCCTRWGSAWAVTRSTSISYSSSTNGA